MRSPVFSILLIILFLCPPLDGWTQAQSAQSTSPSSAVIFERKQTKVVFASDGTSTLDLISVVRIQSEAGVKEMAVLRFPYSSDSQMVEVDYVRVLKPDGSLILTPQYNIQDMSAEATREAPMYSDIHEKHILVKGLGVGDTLEFHLLLRTTKPYIPGEFWFDYTLIKDRIVKEQILEIHIPKGKEVRSSSPDLKPEIKNDGDQTVYRWTHRNLVPQDSKIQNPWKEIPAPSIQLTTFRSWEDVGRWYSSLQKPQILVTPAIQAKAAEITKGLFRDEERIRALYEFVSTHFHYISLSLGLGRYQPHTAEEVLGNEYGDCKDKHTLLTALLKAAGYDAWPALVRSFGKIDTDIPSPGQFNHVITVVPLGEKRLWMDTTLEVAPFRFLFMGIRARPALVMPSGTPAGLMNVPEDPPFPSQQMFSVTGKYDEKGRLSAHIDQVFRGDMEVLVRQMYRRISPEHWKELIQQGSGLVGLRGDVSGVSTSSLENTREAFRISYDIAYVPDSNWEHRQIGIPLPPFGFETGNPDEKPPEEPLLLGAPGEVVYRAKLDLPPRFAPSLPRKVALSTDYADYQALYTIAGTAFTAERRFTIKRKDVALKDWEGFKLFRQAIERDESQLLSSGSPSIEPSSNPESAHQFDLGVSALQRQDIEAAEGFFRRAIDLDPRCPGAHGNLGLCYLSQNRQEDGVKELRVEVSNNPTHIQGRVILANALTAMQKTDEAIEEWSKVLDLDPKNLDALETLPTLLITLGKRQEVTKLLEAALEKDPDNRSLDFKLAQNYLKTGQIEKAISHFRKSITNESSPEDLNQAAYDLAEANVGLDLALGFSEKAVNTLEAQTGDPSTPIEKRLEDTRRMASTWDTLGWVYYRQGDLAKAERYLRAAWDISQGTTHGDHLAQVLERQDRKKEAEYQYGLAFAGLGGNKEEIKQHFRNLTGKVLSRESRFTDSHGKALLAPAEKLGQSRTFHLPLRLKKDGSATFLLAISRKGIDEAIFQDGDERLKPFAEKIKQTSIKAEFPDDGPERIVRQCLLSCGPSGGYLTLMDVPLNIRGFRINEPHVEFRINGTKADTRKRQ